MASAGVVGMAEVIQPNSSSASATWKGSPAMWSFIWVGAAVFYLVFMHLALMGRR